MPTRQTTRFADQLNSMPTTQKIPEFRPKLIIGIGNPGLIYRKTYHNIGFLFIDHLADQLGLKLKKSPSNKFGFAKSKNFVLVKSNLFMNESGGAAAEAKKFFKIPVESTLVVHDDSDLEINHYKLSFDRGSGGHRGIISIIEHLKTKKFWRLRIGIRKNAIAGKNKREKAGSFVLKKITPQDLKNFQLVFDSITEKEIEKANP